MREQQWPTPTYRPPGDGGPAAPVSTQTTVDADDPHAQASFCAVALGYLVEDPHELVVAVLAAGYADRDRDVLEVDRRLTWRTMISIVHPDDVDAPSGTSRRLLFQLVQDRDRDRNSWHLGLNVGRGNIDAEVTRLTALGAVQRYKVDEPSGFHTTMADPEGNLFCVQQGRFARRT